MVKGEKVNLRALKKSDLEHFLRWFNDPDVIYHLTGTGAQGITFEDELEWFDNIRKSKTDRIFAIETLDDQLIGDVGLHNIDWQWRNAEIGIAIGEKTQWNKGYGTEAMRLMVEFAFNTLNLHRIYLNVDADHSGAIKSYERVGFVTEGIMRQHAYKDGRYQDILLMGILKGEVKK